MNITLKYQNCWIIIILIVLICNLSEMKTLKQSRYCEQLPETMLKAILGPAFNLRYMSIEIPHDEFDTNIEPEILTMKRKATIFPSFYVDGNYETQISDKPAWDVDHIPNIMKIREKRTTSGRRQLYQSFIKDNNNNPTRSGRPWECEARTKWIDLGIDYFPRFLRTIECTKSECWYGHFTCKPRSFGIKILRRRRGECAKITDKLTKISGNTLSTEHGELWVWEERAVNFCCDCSAI